MTFLHQLMKHYFMIIYIIKKSVVIIIFLSTYKCHLYLIYIFIIINLSIWIYTYLGGVIGLYILIDLEIHMVFINPSKICKSGGFPSDLSLCIFN